LRAMKSSFKIKICAPQNEDSRHKADLGMDIGTTDLHLSARVCGVYHMFYLELKTKKGKPSPTQVDWMEDFDKNFACMNAKRDIAYGFDEAKKAIDNWIEYLYTINTNN
jgi:hypothetical protein